MLCSHYYCSLNSYLGVEWLELLKTLVCRSQLISNVMCYAIILCCPKRAKTVQTSNFASSFKEKVRTDDGWRNGSYTLKVNQCKCLNISSASVSLVNDYWWWILGRTYCILQRPRNTKARSFKNVELEQSGDTGLQNSLPVEIYWKLVVRILTCERSVYLIFQLWKCKSFPRAQDSAHGILLPPVVLCTIYF